MSYRENPFTRRVNPHRFYRSENRMIAGVSAGIAEYLGWSVGGVRFAVAISCIVFMPFVPILYMIMAFAVPIRPSGLYEDKTDEAFWRTTTLAPRTSFSELRYRFRDMEDRVRSMEAYVTSSKYEFDRELRRTPSVS